METTASKILKVEAELQEARNVLQRAYHRHGVVGEVALGKYMQDIELLKLKLAELTQEAKAA